MLINDEWVGASDGARIDIINPATEFGLAGFVFTKNTKTAFLASEGLDVGMVGVNTLLISSAEIPFGCVGKSGFGREGGIECIDSYTVTKHINITL